MEKSKVYFTDFRTPAYGDGLTTKLQKMLKKAGIEQLELPSPELCQGSG